MMTRSAKLPLHPEEPPIGGVTKDASAPAHHDGDSLHDYLGRKLDNASYLLGFAYSIIESLTGGLPASDTTLAEFRREYDAHFDPKGCPHAKACIPIRPANQEIRGDRD